MALDFRTATITFDPTQGRVQEQPGFVNFSKPVHKADCALKSFNMKFDNGDHHILQETISLSRVAISGTQVTFVVNLLMRDGSGNIDDPFEGRVDVLVIADAG